MRNVEHKSFPDTHHPLPPRPASQLKIVKSFDIGSHLRKVIKGKEGVQLLRVVFMGAIVLLWPFGGFQKKILHGTKEISCK